MAMDNLTVWSRFLARHAKAPLVFLCGVRHPVNPSLYCSPHSHPAIEIVYHPTGRGVTHQKSNRNVAFAEGGVVVYAPNEEHDQVMEAEGEDLCLRIAMPRDAREIPRQCFHVPEVEDAAIIEDIRMLSLSRARLSAAEQAMFNLRATSALYALVHLACTRRRESGEGNLKKYVRKAEQYLRAHFSTVASLREVAAHVGISYDHLRHTFKKQRGVSLVRYLNEVRMDRAKTLLAHSSLPLKQVATTCGFKDEYYFSAAFRRFAGTPPGRYRARLS